MALSEFALIDQYFRECGARRRDVPLGVGDDAALLTCPPGKQLVAAIDTLVDGVHFPKGCAPASIGHRALAVNLSDLAAMGAEPAWALLALTLPASDEKWLSEFARGFGALARKHNVALVGGDTTSGPLSITVQVLGFVEPSGAMLRSGGKPGDGVFVSGTPGDSAGGLMLEQSRLHVADPVQDRTLRDRFLFPTARVDLGARLRHFASACIDVSDGLFADAGKLAAASGCGVQLNLEHLPVSPELIAALGDVRARELSLTGGEDFELCFSVSPSRVDDMQRELPPEQWMYRRIGSLIQNDTATVVNHGIVMDFSHSGFDHFPV